jgi:hypothetical protein
MLFRSITYEPQGNLESCLDLTCHSLEEDELCPLCQFHRL